MLADFPWDGDHAGPKGATMESSGMHEKDDPMKARPQKEHEWLARMVGEWEFEAEGDMGPDKPKVKSGGTESVRSLGGLWIVGEGKGEMPGGGEATTVLTLGFDPRVSRFVGTWIGSMMSHLWIYDGELDEERNVLTLDSEGPDMRGGTELARYRDVIEMRSDDQRVLRSQLLGDDGSWREFMVAHYRRRT